MRGRRAKRGTALLDARVRAHKAFDPYWEGQGWTRKQGYKWLAVQLGIPESEAHMGLMNEDMCERVFQLCVQLSFDDLDEELREYFR